MNQIPSESEYCEDCPCLHSVNDITCFLFGVTETVGSVLELDEKCRPLRHGSCLKQRPQIIMTGQMQKSDVLESAVAVLVKRVQLLRTIAERHSQRIDKLEEGIKHKKYGYRFKNGTAEKINE